MEVTSTAWRTSVTYMRTSAIAGLSHAANARSRMWSFYWLVIFVSGLAATGYNIFTLISDYMDHPVATTTDLVHAPSVYFPAVTICNQNRIHCQNLIDHKLELEAELLSNMELTEEQKAEKGVLVEQLEEMLDVTDCRTQICNFISDAFESYTDDPKNLLAYLVQLNCTPSFMKTFKSHHYEMCYYIHEFFLTDPELMESYWNTVNCSNVDVCNLAYEWSIPPSSFMLPSDATECQKWINEGAFFEGNRDNYFSNLDDSDESGSGSGEEDEEDGGFVFDITELDGSGSAYGPTPTAEESVDEAFIADNDFVTRYMRLNVDLRKAIGHLFGTNQIVELKNNTGMFRTCSFRGESCLDPDLWEMSNVPGYGNCYTFNAAYNDKDDKAPRNATLTGVSNGLSIELFLDQYNYMLKGLSQKAGVRAVIHSPHSFPMIDATGIDLSPGMASSLAIQMNDITRKRPPFKSMCIDEWTETELDISIMAEEKPQYSYSVCQGHCVQLTVIAECDCYHTQLDMSLIDMDKVKFKNFTRPCNRLPNEANNDYTCFSKILAEYDVGDRKCDKCRNACAETHYTSALTTSRWPSNQYWRTLARELQMNEEWLYNEYYYESIQNLIQEDYLKIDIYFQTLNVRKVMQEAKYTGESLFAALGGALSFYLGVAIVLFFEIVELAVFIVLNVWAGKTGDPATDAKNAVKAEREKKEKQNAPHVSLINM